MVLLVSTNQDHISKEKLLNIELNSNETLFLAVTVLVDGMVYIVLEDPETAVRPVLRVCVAMDPAFLRITILVINAYATK